MHSGWAERIARRAARTRAAQTDTIPHYLSAASGRVLTARRPRQAHSGLAGIQHRTTCSRAPRNARLTPVGVDGKRDFTVGDRPVQRDCRRHHLAGRVGDLLKVGVAGGRHSRGSGGQDQGQAQRCCQAAGRRHLAVRSVRRRVIYTRRCLRRIWMDGWLRVSLLPEPQDGSFMWQLLLFLVCCRRF